LHGQKFRLASTSTSTLTSSAAQDEHEAFAKATNKEKRATEAFIVIKLNRTFEDEIHGLDPAHLYP
jgi:hypothetical protein